MIYTEGVRKLFDPGQVPGSSLKDIFAVADALNRMTLVFNGRIYVRTEDRWVVTELTIEDFQVTLE